MQPDTCSSASHSLSPDTGSREIFGGSVPSLPDEADVCELYLNTALVSQHQLPHEWPEAVRNAAGRAFMWQTMLGNGGVHLPGWEAERWIPVSDLTGICTTSAVSNIAGRFTCLHPGARV